MLSAGKIGQPATWGAAEVSTSVAGVCEGGGVSTGVEVCVGVDVSVGMGVSVGVAVSIGVAVSAGVDVAAGVGETLLSAQALNNMSRPSK